jgi:hypothetical protein
MSTTYDLHDLKVNLQNFYIQMGSYISKSNFIESFLWGDRDKGENVGDAIQKKY